MGLIRGQTRPLPVTADIAPKADAQLNASIHNRFDIEVIDVTTGKVRQRAQAENLICDQLWDNLGNGWNNYIAIGTGTGTPSASDNSLFSHLAYYSQSNEKISVDSTNCIAKRQCKCQLTETQYVGKSLTEVGILQSTTSSTLCTHAMFKDANGNTISILKTATDIINIYSTVFVHFTAAKSAMIKAPLTIGDDGLLKTLLGRSGYGSSIQYAYCSPGLCLTYVTSLYFDSTFNKTTKKLTYTAARLGAADGNDYPISFISPVSFAGDSSYWYPQFVIDVGAFSNGTDIVSEPVGTGDGTTKAFSTKFPFASSAKIYVNGVEQSSGVQVTPLPTNRKKAQMYFHGLNPDTLAPIIAVWEYAGDAAVFYNPYYEIGISSVIAKTNYTYVECSNDLTNWVGPISNDSDLTVGNEYAVVSAYQHYKYWRVMANNPADLILNCADKSIVFGTAPASGAVIIADYHTPVIAKDANHVFDFSMTIQLGEYTG